MRLPTEASVCYVSPHKGRKRLEGSLRPRLSCGSRLVYFTDSPSAIEAAPREGG